MGRSGYSDCDYDYSEWDAIRWRGAVKSATRGARGQKLLRDLLKALDAMPVKRLVKGQLRHADGEVCTLGAVCRDIPRESLPTYDEEGDDDWEGYRNELSRLLDVAPALVAEIVFHNDDSHDRYNHPETPEERFTRMRAWVESKIDKKARA